MGPLEGMLDMIPGGKALKSQVAGTDTDKEVRRMEAIILSMTARERAHPELIDGARKRRIARGSGVQPADVNRLLKARETMQKLAKQFGRSRWQSRGGPAVWTRRSRLVKIRLRRMGAKKHPFYRLVVADARSPRDGRFIEHLGYYDPMTDPVVIKIDGDKVVRWLQQGAQPTEAARSLLKREGILERLAETRKSTASA